MESDTQRRPVNGPHVYGYLLRTNSEARLAAPPPRSPSTADSAS